MKTGLLSRSYPPKTSKPVHSLCTPEKITYFTG